MVDLVAEKTGVEVHPSQSVESLRALAERHGVRWEARWGSGKLIEEIFEAVAETSLIEPTFVTGHPVEISPLARADRNDPHLTERFELFVGTRELANSTTPSSSVCASRRSRRPRTPATPNGARSTRTTCAPSSTGCRPPAASE
jgi:lysyl-tRNA synthetase class II